VISVSYSNLIDFDVCESTDIKDDVDDDDGDDVSSSTSSEFVILPSIPGKADGDEIFSDNRLLNFSTSYKW